MQIRSGHFVFLIVLCVVEAILKFWPTTWSDLMPESARITIAIVGAVAIVGLILWWAWPYLQRIFVKKPITQERIAKAQIKGTQPIANYKKVLSMLGQEPSNKPSVSMNSISTICSLIIFIYGLLILNLWYTGKLHIQNSLYWFFFIGLFIVFPLLILLDIYVWEKKYFKMKKSHVEKHKTFTLRGNLDVVFDGCLKVFENRIRMKKNSQILKMERPKSIKAIIGGSVIIVETRQVKKGVVEIYFQSDSQWLTTKFDFGLNQRNVDLFEGLILAEVGQ